MQVDRFAAETQRPQKFCAHCVLCGRPFGVVCLAENMPAQGRAVAGY